MSLYFDIIPTLPRFYSTAHDIQSKITNNFKLQVNIHIDTDTDVKIQTRIYKWKKKGYNIILIDEDYDETNSIIVTFSEKGSRPQAMHIDEFIDIISSYDDTDTDTDTDTNNNKNNNTNNNNNNDELCTIM